MLPTREFFRTYDELSQDAGSLAESRKQLQGAVEARDRVQAQLKAARQEVVHNNSFIKEQEDRIVLVSQHWFYGTTAFQPQLWLRGGCQGKIDRAQTKLNKAQDVDRPRLLQAVRILEERLPPLESRVKECTDRRNRATDASHERSKMREQTLSDNPSPLLLDLQREERERAQRLKSDQNKQAEVEKLVRIKEGVLGHLEHARRHVQDAENKHRELQRLVHSAPSPPSRSRREARAYSTSERGAHNYHRGEVPAQNRSEVVSSHSSNISCENPRHQMQNRRELEQARHFEQSRLQARQQARGSGAQSHCERQDIQEQRYHQHASNNSDDAEWRDYERSLRTHDNRVRDLERQCQEQQDRVQTAMRHSLQGLRDFMTSLTSPAIRDTLLFDRREEMRRVAVEASDALSIVSPSSSSSVGSCPYNVAAARTDGSFLRATDGKIEMARVRLASLSGLLTDCQREHQDKARQLRNQLTSTQDAISVEKDTLFERLRKDALEDKAKTREDTGGGGDNEDSAFVPPPPINPEALGVVAASAPAEEDLVQPLPQGKTIVSRDYGV